MFSYIRQFLLTDMLRSFTFILIINTFGCKSTMLSFVLFCFLFFSSFYYLLLSYLNIFLVFHFNLSYVLTSLNLFSVFIRLILCILEKEMATHSSVLAWRIPGTGEPSGADVCRVAQSQTRLKWLSSSSSILCVCKLSVYFIPISGVKKSYHSMFPSTLPANVVGILYITVAYIEIFIRWYILFPFNLKAYFKDIKRKRMVCYIYLS